MEQIECGEDWAESAAWYVTNACQLLVGGNNKDAQSGKLRYDYFKANEFEGREYLPAGGCP